MAKTEIVMTGTELDEKPLASVRQMKVDETANRIRNHGAQVLSERAPGVVNPSEAEMSVIVNDLRS